VNKFNTSLNKILLDSITDMVFIMSVVNSYEFIYEYLNYAALNNTTYKEDIIGQPIYKVNSTETATLLYKHYQEAARNQTIVTYKDTYRSTLGHIRYAKTKLTPIINEHKQCTHIIAIVKDITHKINISKQLEESEEHLRIIVENAKDLITLINHRGEIIFTSPSYKSILGFDHKEYIGQYFLHNVHPDDRGRVSQQMQRAIKNKDTFTVKFRQYNYKNERIWSEANGAPVYDAHDTFKHLVVVTRDISKQKEYEAKLKHFALHDSLTGLLNRRLFNEYLTAALNNIQEHMNKIAVIMLDVDNFKNINDQFGHDTGDEVIKEFGKRICQSLSEKNIVARLGGDEFIILLPSITTIHEVIDLAEKIKMMMQKPWKINENILNVTSSMGIAITSTKQTAHSIWKQADIALYQAKCAGGNTYKLKD